MNKPKLILLLLIFSHSILAAPDPKNQIWEVFTNRSWITAIALSEDTLWVGAKGGGLEQRNALTGQLVRVLTTITNGKFIIFQNCPTSPFTAFQATRAKAYGLEQRSMDLSTAVSRVNGQYITPIILACHTMALVAL